ncbi:N-acetylglucosamine kinase [Abditibacterium utsteinense]|nr:BadF/BadG/BcrA/BcrD ATPase family protein [Abditibacterium utsteinense]
MRYFIGIDGGGTLTRAVVIDGKREVLGRGEAGASNHHSVRAEVAAQNCALAVKQAIADAENSHPEFDALEIAAWGFGLAGVRRPNDYALMQSALEGICARPFSLETDVVAAHAGAFSGQPGIVLSAGTGGICFGADEHGEKFYADGLGPLIGDEGGGYWMGIEALRATGRALDGRGPKTRLAAPVMEHLGVETLDELVEFAHSQACSREKVASLSRVVFSLADQGSNEAAQIRARAAALLSSSVKSVARAMLSRRLERAMTDGDGVSAPLEVLVALRGGLFEDEFLRASLGYAVTEIMVELKRDFLPIASWKIVKPRYDAAVGAAILGQLVA